MAQSVSFQHVDKPLHSVFAELMLAEANHIEDVQLTRLASAVLSKSPADMAALAEDNPELFDDWIGAFLRKKQEADAAARLWTAAIACLSTASADFEDQPQVIQS
jgi:hypothetical protein